MFYGQERSQQITFNLDVLAEVWPRIKPLGCGLDILGISPNGSPIDFRSISARKSACKSHDRPWLYKIWHSSGLLCIWHAMNMPWMILQKPRNLKYGSKRPQFHHCDWNCCIYMDEITIVNKTKSLWPRE